MPTPPSLGDSKQVLLFKIATSNILTGGDPAATPPSMGDYEQVLLYKIANALVSGPDANTIYARLDGSNLATLDVAEWVTTLSVAKLDASNLTNPTDITAWGNTLRVLRPRIVVTASRNLAASDANAVLVYTGAGNITLTNPGTLPATFECTVIQGGAGTITFAGTVNNFALTTTGGLYARVDLANTSVGLVLDGRLA